jgi:hypothetical protein
VTGSSRSVAAVGTRCATILVAVGVYYDDDASGVDPLWAVIARRGQEHTVSGTLRSTDRDGESREKRERSVCSGSHCGFVGPEGR